MTESQWLRGDRPEPMLVSLRHSGSDRKCRLYACGCFRSIWDGAFDEASARRVDVAERFADAAGPAAPEVVGQELAAAEDAVVEEIISLSPSTVLSDELDMLFDTWRCVVREKPHVLGIDFRSPTRWGRLRRAAGRALDRVLFGVHLGGPFHPQTRCRVLRCVFGNPFRPVTLDPRWLTAPVVALARTMYDSREFAPMPVLADALEEAGCDNPAVLAHCRGPGPHVRGCWVTDSIQ